MNNSELITIKEFRTRKWGENGTPPSRQAIRNMIQRGDIPAEQIGKKWFIDWTTYLLRQRAGCNNLVEMVLRKRGN